MVSLAENLLCGCADPAHAEPQGYISGQPISAVVYIAVHSRNHNTPQLMYHLELAMILTKAGTFRDAAWYI